METTLSGEMIAILATPIFVSAGEEALTVEVDCDAPDGIVSLVVVDDAGDYVHNVPMTGTIDDEGEMVHRAFPQFTVTSAVYYVFIMIPLTELGIETKRYRISNWRIFPSRATAFDAPPSGDIDDGLANIFPVPEDESLAWQSGKSIIFETIPDEVFDDDAPVPGWVIDKMNRNINALREALTGAPLPGNRTTVNEDSDATDPTLSRFIAHTRAGTDLADEAPIDFPVFAEALGAIKACGEPVVNETVDDGWVDWYAPWPLTIGEATIRQRDVYLPDFPSGTGETHLYLTILFASEGSQFPEELEVTAHCESFTTSAVAITQLQEGFNDSHGGFWRATLGPIEFNADDVNTLKVTCEVAGATALFGEFFAVGWCAYFMRDP